MALLAAASAGGFNAWALNWGGFGGGGGSTIIYNHNTYITRNTWNTHHNNYNGYHPWGGGSQHDGHYDPHRGDRPDPAYRPGVGPNGASHRDDPRFNPGVSRMAETTIITDGLAAKAAFNMPAWTIPRGITAASAWRRIATQVRTPWPEKRIAPASVGMDGPIAWKPIAAEAAWQGSSRGVAAAHALNLVLRLADAAVKRPLFST